MKILLAGAGGFGALYVDLLYRAEAVEWVGVADPFASASPAYDKILEKGIPVYDTIDAFFEEHTADLTVIAAPTYLHEEMTKTVLKHGSYVLCEKPAAPVEANVLQMLEAERESGLFAAIGFQWSFSKAIQALKKDVLGGRLGKPLSLKTFVSWPRNRAYFTRGTGWAGRIMRNGAPLLDSIASNACGHYLHNMLFVLGDTMETAAEAVSVVGDCLRANAIENFDTCTVRFRTAAGVPLLFAASHAVDVSRNPEFVYEFEHATVHYAEDEGSRIIAEFDDGTVVDYGDPFENSFDEKFYACVRAAEAGEPPICTVKTAIPHVRAVELLWHEVPIRDFPAELVRVNEKTNGLYVEGLYGKLRASYEAGMLLSELEA